MSFRPGCSSGFLPRRSRRPVGSCTPTCSTATSMRGSRLFDREAVLNDPATDALIARLPDWGLAAEFSEHQHPAFAPNLPDGRFAMFATSRVAPQGGWGSLLCDTHAVAEVVEAAKSTHQAGSGASVAATTRGWLTLPVRSCPPLGHSGGSGRSEFGEQLADPIGERPKAAVFVLV